MISRLPLLRHINVLRKMTEISENYWCKFHRTMSLIWWSVKGFVLSSRKLSALLPISSYLSLEKEDRRKITRDITVLNVLMNGPGANLKVFKYIAHSVVFPELLDRNEVLGYLCYDGLFEDQRKAYQGRSERSAGCI